MSITATSRTMSDTYFELVKAFPLTHIQDDEHLAEAQEKIDELLRMDLDEGEQQYLDALTDLVEIYEDKNVMIPAAPAEGVLRALMESNRLSQNTLAKQTGIAQSTISDVLTGKRSLTIEHIQILAKRFGVVPAVFLSA